MTSGNSGTSGAGTTVETEIGLLYGPGGKQLDLYRPAEAAGPLPTVLLWHGIGPDERDVLAPLARTAAARGLLVLVPDWRSDAADGGRSQLLASLAFTRKEAAGLGGDGESVVLAGWSAGAGAALGVALRPELTADGWRPTAVAGIAGRYDLPARTTGTAPLADLAESRDPAVPVHLVHGSRDPIVPPRYSHDLADALRAGGRPVTLQEPDTDHAGVIMTAYDPTTDRCIPTSDGAAVAAGRLVAGVLAAAGGAAGAEHS
ncbi:alpha/beta hydrolase family protein [Streptomyces sp. NRRL S-337]|uniref:alpha/beta hydrolase family protein n=1 Tax=Streptomyces sp. NRRL S-337 TaxID=1463900 RepID=UPI0004CB0F41|nr:alpha/beta hydrolase [Streptomyces sp. NRRL S-337]